MPTCTEGIPAIPVGVEESVGATDDVERCRTSNELLVSTEHALYVGRGRGGGAGS